MFRDTEQRGWQACWKRPRSSSTASVRAADRTACRNFRSATGLPKPTVHRLAADLVGLGWLERSGPRYLLGAKLFELGSLVPHRRDLRETALPFLQDLFEATRESIHLGVREGMEVVYLERIHGHEALRLPSRIGGSLPLTCTAVGKALLPSPAPS